MRTCLGQLDVWRHWQDKEEQTACLQSCNHSWHSVTLKQRVQLRLNYLDTISNCPNDLVKIRSYWKPKLIVTYIRLKWICLSYRVWTGGPGQDILFFFFFHTILLWQRPGFLLLIHSSVCGLNFMVLSGSNLLHPTKWRKGWKRDKGCLGAVS